MPRYILSHSNLKEAQSFTSNIDTYIDLETGFAFFAKTDPILESYKEELEVIKEQGSYDDNKENKEIYEKMIKKTIRNNTERNQLEGLASSFNEALLTHEHAVSAKPAKIKSLEKLTPSEKPFPLENPNPTVISEISNIITFRNFSSATVEEAKIFEDIITSPNFIPTLARMQVSNYVFEENDANDTNIGINPKTKTMFKMDQNQSLWSLTCGFVFDQEPENTEGHKIPLSNKYKNIGNTFSDEQKIIHRKRGINPEMVLDSSQFKVSSQDILNLCHLQKDAKYRPLSMINDWMPAIYDRFHGKDAFIKLDENEAFSNAKFETFLKYILMKKLNNHLIDNSFDKKHELQKNLKTKRHVLNKHEAISKALFSLPEFRSYYFSHGEEACKKIRAEFAVFLKKSGLQGKEDFIGFDKAVIDINYQLSITSVRRIKKKKHTKKHLDSKATSSVSPAPEIKITPPRTELVSLFDENDYRLSLQSIADFSKEKEEEKKEVEVTKPYSKLLKSAEENGAIFTKDNPKIQKPDERTLKIINALFDSSSKFKQINILPSINPVQNQLPIDANAESCLEAKNVITNLLETEKNRYLKEIKPTIENIQEIQELQKRLAQSLKELGEFYQALQRENQKDDVTSDYKLLLTFAKKHYPLVYTESMKLTTLIETKMSKMTKVLNGYYANANQIFRDYQNLIIAYNQLADIFNVMENLSNKINISSASELDNLYVAFSDIQHYGIQPNPYIDKNIYTKISNQCTKHMDTILNKTFQNPNNYSKELHFDNQIKTEPGFFKRNKKRLLIGLGIGLLLGLCILIPPVGALVTSVLLIKLAIIVGSTLIGGLSAAVSTTCRKEDNTVKMIDVSSPLEETSLKVNLNATLNSNNQINNILGQHIPTTTNEISSNTSNTVQDISTSLSNYNNINRPEYNTEQSEIPILDVPDGNNYTVRVS